MSNNYCKYKKKLPQNIELEQERPSDFRGTARANRRNYARNKWKTKSSPAIDVHMKSVRLPERLVRRDDDTCVALVSVARVQNDR